MPEIVSNTIKLKHDGNTIDVSAKLGLKNNTHQELKKLVFSLNSGLKVKSLKINGTETPFEREKHLILVDGIDMKEDSETTLEMNYRGHIDEALCYLDIDEKTMQEKHGTFVINVDKRFAFVNPGLCIAHQRSQLGIPKQGVTYSTSDVKWNHPQFSNYTLEVKTSPGADCCITREYGKNIRQYICV